MKLPGFSAEKAIYRSAGKYKMANAADSRVNAVIEPQLPRAVQCTTVYSGYITYPFKGPCRSLLTSELSGGMAIRAQASAFGISEAPAQAFSPIIGTRVVCPTRSGPWLAYVEQKESCNTFEPDDFTMTILGPQQVVLNWKGSMDNAPAAVGALGNLFPTIPTCSCCGSRKQCPDGSCIPLSASCGPTNPA
jgi:hypothetical protein